ncbi:AAEL013416-PA [Aedes aegypti]|uniref:AAEL013416-PA n=1 Tax=Aedes aegypti TaxID=7159 RepID=Q16J77_AEDAE|nr:AAEL013416-PA [Aedes aegypti]
MIPSSSSPISQQQQQRVSSPPKTLANKSSGGWDLAGVSTGTVKRRPSSLGSKEGTPPGDECKDDGPRSEQFGGADENGTGVPNRGNMKSAKQSKIAVLRQKKTSNLLTKTTNDNKPTSQQKLKNNIIPPKKLVKQSTSTSNSGGESAGGRGLKKVSFIAGLSVEGAPIKSSTVKVIVRSRQQSLSDTGVQFKELYRDFPLGGNNSVPSDGDQVNLAAIGTPPPLPPYRDPPPPPPPSSSGKVVLEVIQQDLISMEPVSKNEDVIPKETNSKSKLKGFGSLGKLISSSTGLGEKKSNNYVTLPSSPKFSKMSSKGAVELPAPPVPAPPSPPSSPEVVCEGKRELSPDDIPTKPEFSSLLLKNLPVRQRKGAVPHLENYCLFDPSVDFFNEKEHKMRTIPETVELADPLLYQNPLIYDAVDRDSDNYFTIEPESFDVEARNRLSLEKVEEKIDEIFNKTRTSSSSSGSSPDYPSMVNSVIETPSSNLESTDESDYGFRNRLIEQLQVVPKSISGSINGDQQESSYYGVVTKTAVTQFERLHRQQSTSLPNSPLLQQRKSDESSSSSPPSSSTKTTDSSSNEPSSSAHGTLCSEEPLSCSPPPPAPASSHPTPTNRTATKIKSDPPVSKVHFLPFLSFDPLKSSVSLPHLQKAPSATGAISKHGGHVPYRNASLDSTPLFNRLRKQRPLSNHSDADSGFLSPATPPDSTGQSIQNQILAADQQQQLKRLHQEQVDSSDTVVVLEQCDSIQELIQVSG